MADQDFAQVARRLIVRAIDEATGAGSPAVEAEHLLLAIVADPGPVEPLLAESGLDRAAVERMLRIERARSLEAAGIERFDEQRLATTPRRSRPGWGASAREAIARGGRLARRDRQRLSEADLLTGILLAELGTVPRAFAYAGVDRDALVARLNDLAGVRGR
ncbi:Clp protease N-terminal domain-containing protein [Agromyces larvae]|uniref:Clp R domain-containing protein n=1 Tax=Agromyces larvae TaxID=2929802 RepID=A0ABY4C3L7_9MICO|nr:Clp protease N-terminal domain-containing protein [Agromyces larvae]UOE45804.1 hypothetical protein MTO99_08685 [Agromyces larvae]